MDAAINVIGGLLVPCSHDPKTGWFRDGCCNTDENDMGSHTVCCLLTWEFIEFLQLKGNDLISPAPQYGFPGLKEGDRWCLCTGRWFQAYEDGYAPKIILSSTSIEIVKYIDKEILKKFALDLN